MSQALRANQIEIGDSLGPNGVLLGTGTDWTVNPNSLVGMGLATVRVGDQPNPGSHGVTFGPDFRGGKTIEIEAWGKAGSEPLAVRMIDDLKRVWALPDDGYRNLRFRLGDYSDTRILYGRPRDLQVDYSLVRAGTVRVLMSFASQDWVFYDDVASSASIILPSTSPGKGFPLTFPVGFGVSGADIIAIGNYGTATTRPIITVVGPITNPKVENIAAEEFMQLNLTLDVGQIIVIDMAARTALLNGTASRKGTMTVGSKWLSVLPLTTAIFRFSGSPGVSAPGASVSWRSAWA